MEGKAPLWYYVLAEAEQLQDGLRLGPVGGRIVAETILGILDSDKDSYFHERDWQPMPPAGPASASATSSRSPRPPGAAPPPPSLPPPIAAADRRARDPPRPHRPS